MNKLTNFPTAGVNVLDPTNTTSFVTPADLDYKKAHRDISRLLRAAKSWDGAGRGVVYE